MCVCCMCDIVCAVYLWCESGVCVVCECVPYGCISYDMYTVCMYGIYVVRGICVLCVMRLYMHVICAVMPCVLCVWHMHVVCVHRYMCPNVWYMCDVCVFGVYVECVCCDIVNM